MNFFVSFFSLKVFKGCGQPRLGKRSATTSEINFESVKFDRAGSGGSGTGGANVRPTTAAGTSLDRLVRDIKQKVGFKVISSLVFQTLRQRTIMLKFSLNSLHENKFGIEK